MARRASSPVGIQRLLDKTSLILTSLRWYKGTRVPVDNNRDSVNCTIATPEKKQETIEKFHQKVTTIVMRSNKMSLNSKKIKTKFSFSLNAAIPELYYAENPIKIEHTVAEI